jgi:predicted DNA-binding transcriptional regulator AlpA
MAETNTNPDPSGRTATRKPLTCSLPEAAARMGVRVLWLQEKVKAREVPFTQTGKASVGFTDEQITEVIEALTVKPKNDPRSLTTARAKKRVA